MKLPEKNKVSWYLELHHHVEIDRVRNENVNDELRHHRYNVDHEHRHLPNHQPVALGKGIG